MIMWERTPPKFLFRARVIMTPEQFQALPEVAGDAEQVGREMAKALLDTGHGPRWHAVERHLEFGRPLVFARPISVRIYQPEE